MPRTSPKRYFRSSCFVWRESALCCVLRAVSSAGGRSLFHLADCFFHKMCLSQLMKAQHDALGCIFSCWCTHASMIAWRCPSIRLRSNPKCRNRCSVPGQWAAPGQEQSQARPQGCRLRVQHGAPKNHQSRYVAFCSTQICGIRRPPRRI
jgi:hypothetical protein